MKITPTSELTAIFISLTIIIISLAGFGYFYLTQNQNALMNEFEHQRVLRAEIVNEILANLSGELQQHDDKLTMLLEHLNITDKD